MLRYISGPWVYIKCQAPPWRLFIQEAWGRGTEWEIPQGVQGRRTSILNNPADAYRCLSLVCGRKSRLNELTNTTLGDREIPTNL